MTFRSSFTSDTFNFLKVDKLYKTFKNSKKAARWVYIIALDLREQLFKIKGTYWYNKHPFSIYFRKSMKTPKIPMFRTTSELFLDYLKSVLALTFLRNMIQRDVEEALRGKRVWVFFRWWSDCWGQTSSWWENRGWGWRTSTARDRGVKWQ